MLLIKQKSKKYNEPSEIQRIKCKYAQLQKHSVFWSGLDTLVTHLSSTRVVRDSEVTQTPSYTAADREGWSDKLSFTS